MISPEREYTVNDRTPITRRSIPVISKFVPSMPSQYERIAKIAERISANEPALSFTNFFGTQVESGLFDGPALLIGDDREIALRKERDAQAFEYRISHLAANDDMLLLSGNRNAAFEHYREHSLGLGAIDVITLPLQGGDNLIPLATRCLSNANALNRIVARAQKAGTLTILPYIGRGSAWLLAAAVAERSGMPVRVAASPPKLTTRVNDKVWFAHRVDEVLGPRAQPSYRAVFGPAALAARTLRLARESERIVIKVPDSAGSDGNISLSASEIQALPLDVLRERLILMLSEIGWGKEYPLLVEIWDTPVLASPSVQMWIPDRRTGAPILEGVFEQVVAGPKGEFVGSTPPTFPEGWSIRIGEEALTIATLFQHLGYFGRCSFDAVIAGRDYSTAILHWLECNGRWGGVSIPMTLANRLSKYGRHSNFVVVQRDKVSFSPCEFSAALNRLKSVLYCTGESPEGVVLISPLGIERGSAVHLMVLADGVERAQNLAEHATRILMGRVDGIEPSNRRPNRQSTA